jgi:hypothetical protein
MPALRKVLIAAICTELKFQTSGRLVFISIITIQICLIFCFLRFDFCFSIFAKRYQVGIDIIMTDMVIVDMMYLQIHWPAAFLTFEIINS